MSPRSPAWKWRNPARTLFPPRLVPRPFCTVRSPTDSAGEPKTESYAVAYDNPGCHRTSNAVDRPMNRLCRLMYAGRGLHGHQGSSELRLRGWALLLNFRPYAPRSNQPRTHDSPAHRLNGKRHHEHWLHNLLASTSLMGFRNRQPAIR